MTAALWFIRFLSQTVNKDKATSANVCFQRPTTFVDVNAGLAKPRVNRVSAICVKPMMRDNQTDFTSADQSYPDSGFASNQCY